MFNLHQVVVGLHGLRKSIRNKYWEYKYVDYQYYYLFYYYYY